MSGIRIDANQLRALGLQPNALSNRTTLFRQLSQAVCNGAEEDDEHIEGCEAQEMQEHLEEQNTEGDSLAERFWRWLDNNYQVRMVNMESPYDNYLTQRIRMRQAQSQTPAPQAPAPAPEPASQGPINAAPQNIAPQPVAPVRRGDAGPTPVQPVARFISSQQNGDTITFTFSISNYNAEELGAFDARARGLRGAEVVGSLSVNGNRVSCNVDISGVRASGRFTVHVLAGEQDIGHSSPIQVNIAEAEE